MTNTAAPGTAQNNGSIVKSQPNIVDSTLQRISDMQANKEIMLPKDYSASNAMRSAWLILQEVKDMNKRPALEVCTKESIAYALLNMALQGLNPVKRQCSFIVYGNKLVMQREYQGAITVAKRAGLKSVIANPVFDGDDFAFEVDVETGRKKVTKHIPSFENFGGKVKGAYAMIEMEDGTKNVEVMSMAQIQKAWEQGQTKGQSPAHKNFPDQMACKTVIGRALKTIINSSDDAALFEEEEQVETPFTAAVKHEIETNSNGAGTTEAIGFDDENDKAASYTGEQITEEQETQVIQTETQGKIPF